MFGLSLSPIAIPNALFAIVKFVRVGEAPWQRIAAINYEYYSATENIAAGYTTPEAVVEDWMNSDGHRDNILNCNLQEIGVGHYYLANDSGSVNYHHYWTQILATPQ